VTRYRIMERFGRRGGYDVSWFRVEQQQSRYFGLRSHWVTVSDYHWTLEEAEASITGGDLTASRLVKEITR
jgi:hypothetical protein